MSDGAPKRALGWWEKRELEQRLAGEMSSAYEVLRLAQLSLSDAIAAASQGVQPPDSNLNFRQALSLVQTANETYLAAMKRGKDFVTHGVQPSKTGEST
jgi:hypothetical protein